MSKPPDLNTFLYSPAAGVEQTMRLNFRHPDTPAAGEEAMHRDISGICAQGDWLWLVSDETTALERLRRDGEGYAAHHSYDLGAIFDLPGDTEIDLEGLAIDRDWLWLTGSHALKRKKPRPAQDRVEETLQRLETVVREENRYFLARVPLEDRGNGPEPARKAADGRRAGLVRMKKGGNDLSRALKKDQHLAPFLKIPAKENGFDIEAIAVQGERVLLGLRGPVLRGIAVMLEIVIEDDGKGRLRLDDNAFDTDIPYRKHFLDLGGMGIRDLHLESGKLLLLVGPTMDLDGPVAVLSLPDPFREGFHHFTRAAELGQVLRVPHGPGTDHAEGLTCLPDGRLLVVYDSPDPTRLGDGFMTTDVFPSSAT